MWVTWRLLSGQDPQKRLCKWGIPKSLGLQTLPNDSHHLSLQYLLFYRERLTNLSRVTQLINGLVRIWAQIHPIPKPRLPSHCHADTRPRLGHHLQMPSLTDSGANWQQWTILQHLRFYFLLNSDLKTTTRTTKNPTLDTVYLCEWMNALLDYSKIKEIKAGKNLRGYQDNF